MKKDIYAFLEETKYCIVLSSGQSISGVITQTFENGIEINGTYRIPQFQILYWYEIE